MNTSGAWKLRAEGQQPSAKSKWNADPPAADTVKRIQRISAD